MKNLWRLLAVLPLRACPELAEGVRGSQRGSYVIRDLLHFGRKPLVVRGFSLVRRNGTENCRRESFGNCLYAVTRQPPRLANMKGKPTKRIVCTLTTKPQSASPHGSQKQMVDDETNRMYFSNLIGRPTYEREHLNLGKTGDSHKTNPSQLRRVSRPAPTARENTWQTNETNHAYVGVKRAAGNRLTYEKRVARLQKTSHSYKTNHPGFPHTLPPF